MELGAALALLEKAEPTATQVVRRYLTDRTGDPLDRLLRVAVDPVWKHAVKATEDLAAGKQAEAKATEHLARALDDRNKLWSDTVLPKVLPAVGLLLMVLVVWLAVQLGVAGAVSGVGGVGLPGLP